MSQPNNQSIIGKALFKGTLMALTNACIIWLILYIANMDKSVLMVVAVVVAAAFGYVTAFLEARAMQNAARGGDVSTSSSVVDSSDSSDSSDEEEEEDDFVDPGPDPDAGDFDAGSSSSSSSSDYSSYSSSDYSGGGDSGGGDSGGSSD